MQLTHWKTDRCVVLVSMNNWMGKTYKPSGSNSLFPEDFMLRKLSKQGDLLERLNQVVDWDFFRKADEKALNTNKMVNAGPKPYDSLLKFKILILQRYYNLSDEQIEYQILDRLTFAVFWGYLSMIVFRKKRLFGTSGTGWKIKILTKNYLSCLEIFLKITA